MSIFKEYPNKFNKKYYTRKGQIIRKKNTDDTINPVQYGEEYCKNVLLVYNYLNVRPYLVYTNLINYGETIPMKIDFVTDNTGQLFSIANDNAWHLGTIHRLVEEIDPYLLELRHFNVDIVSDHFLVKVRKQNATAGEYKFTISAWDGETASADLQITQDRTTSETLVNFSKYTELKYYAYIDNPAKQIMNPSFINGKNNFFHKHYENSDQLDVYEMVKNQVYGSISDKIGSVYFNSYPGTNVSGMYIEFQFFFNFVYDLQFTSNVDYNQYF